MKNLWIVVADGTSARFHSWNRGSTAPQLVDELSHPEGRLHSSDLVSDRPGVQSDGGMRPHGLAQRESPADLERERFAHHVAATVNNGVASGSCSGFALVMAPKMLGLVREGLSASARHALAGTIDRRLVDVPIGEVVQQLNAVLGPKPLV